MFCGKCGSQILQGARFCTRCGTPVEKYAAWTAPLQKPAKQAPIQQPEDQEPIQQPEDQAPIQQPAEQAPIQQPEDQEPIQQPEDQEPIQQSEDQEPIQQPAKQAPIPKPEEQADIFGMDEPYVMEKKSDRSKKHSHNALIIAIIAVVVVVFLGVAAFIGFKVILPAVSNNSNQMVYLKDNKLYYLKDMSNPDKAIEVDTIRDMDYLVGAEFSEDGKYLYYYSEEHDNGYALNRIKISKLKANRSSEKYIEEIASNVKNYYLSSNNTLYYRDKKNQLIRYKNGKEMDLKKDVEQFYISKDNKTLYYESGEQNDYEIGSIDLSKGTDTKIDSDIADVYLIDTEGFFVYTKNQKDDTEDLYVTDANQEPFCLAEGILEVLDVDTASGTVYYEYGFNTEKSLYDYVNDTENDSDSEVKEPEIKDALTEVSEDDVFNAVMDDSDKEKYLTGKKKDKKKYYNKLPFDEEYQMYFAFGIDTFDAYYYDKSTKKWFVYDEDKYEAAYEQYMENASRADLRQQLKEATYSFLTGKICSASESQAEKVLCEDVSNLSWIAADENIIIYEKRENEIEKINLDDVEFPSDVYEYLDAQQQDTYYVIGSGPEQKLDIEDNVYVSSCDGSAITLFARDDNNTLYYGNLSGDASGTFDKIDDDVVEGSATWVDHVLYYLKDMSSDGEATICKFEDGNSTVIRKDVHSVISVTSDSELLEYSDELKLYDMSGGDTEIAKDVDSYTYLSKNKILYMSNDDLYLYTPSEDKLKIAKNVLGYSTYSEQWGESELVYGIYGY